MLRLLLPLGPILSLLVALPANAKDCRVASILYGGVAFDILPHISEMDVPGYETAIIRSAVFSNPEKPFGAILGELTVDRGGFAIRTPRQEVVGVVTPALKLEGWDDECDGSRNVEIVSVKRGSFVILSDGSPVGTIEGRFPKNGFGANSE